MHRRVVRGLCSRWFVGEKLIWGPKCVGKRGNYLGCYYSSRFVKTQADPEAMEHYKLTCYEKGEPIITDQEYDKLYQDLLELEKRHPDLGNASSPTQQVAPALSDDITKRRHHLPMLGLQNTYNNEQITKFETRVCKEIASRDVSSIPIDYVTEMKYDGMAISLIFENGRFSYALTRGDGLYGEDVTRNFLTHVTNLPLKEGTIIVPHKEDIVEIRGEVICSTKEYNRVNAVRKEKGLKQFSTARNLTTGTISKSDGSDNEEDIVLDMICYSLHIYKAKEVSHVSNMDDLEQFVTWSSSQPETQWECLEMLKKWSFPICPRAQRYSSMDEVFNYIHKYESPEYQEKFPYTTDGAVLKVNSIKQQLVLGRIARSYRWAIAYKFPTEIYATKLLDIQFQVGRTGKATPVAHLEKVVIDGSNVSRATLHNPSFIEQHKIEIGDLVKVEKSGGTIPKISGLADPASKADQKEIAPLQLVCPCEKRAPLVKHDDYVDVFCSDPFCVQQQMRTILHFSKSLSILGLGESLVQQMLEAGVIKSVGDIFILHEKQEQLLEMPRMGEKKIQNLIKSIEKAKKGATLPKILFALAIPAIGDTMGKQLAKKYKTITNIASKSYAELLEDGFTSSVATNIEAFFKAEANQKLLEDLHRVGLVS